MSVGKICVFDVEKGVWSSYVERLEMYFVVNEVKEELKLPTISAMGDEAYELLVNLASPKKPSQLRYNEAVELLRSHLQPRPSVLTERYRFRQRRQMAEESVNNYVAELKRLARNCAFNETLNQNLRDQFVCGIKNDVIRQRLFAEDENLNFLNAVKIATSLEAAERDAAAVDMQAARNIAAPSSAEMHVLQPEAARARARGGGPRRAHGTNGAASGALRARAGPSGAVLGERGGGSDTPRNCRGCGATGHWYQNCRFRDYVCSMCKCVGHLRRVCPDAGAGLARRTTRGQASGGRGIHYGAAGVEDEQSDEEPDDEDCLDLHQLSLRNYEAV